MNDDLETPPPADVSPADVSPVEASPADVPPVDTNPVDTNPAPRARARRLVGTVLPAVLVLGAIAGGLGFIKTTVDGADRTAPTTVWTKTIRQPGDDPAGDFAKGRTETELSKRLLPVPAGYTLGPDVEGYGHDGYGNDGELTDKQATALMKSAGKGLSGSLRRALNKEIDKLGVKGIAVRSYSADMADLVAEVYLMRTENSQFLRSWYAAETDWPGARKGPKIEGHGKARCFLAPKSGGEFDLDSMRCVAYDGDLAVTLLASGVKPFDSAAAAELMKDQLDHIASPGKYV
ncbi:hypothetical protein ACFRMN_25540 [Streptomyces sp. NPDC056835]|uniref:hypothetical protein n=1 Tax=Streptomyces sp. NPDC056835 TaxID=3345956 RepID=UPI003675BB3C